MREQSLGSIPPPSDNPFSDTEARAEAERRYAQAAVALARRFIYMEQSLDEAEVEKATRNLLRLPALAALEKERHEFEALLHLIEGMAAHERAEIYHAGSWQMALAEQPGRETGSPRPPETLTRDEVAREFAAYPFRQQLLAAEQQALDRYQKLLKLKGDFNFQLTENISIEHTDIEMLVNDLKTQIAERLADPQERQASLVALDRELVEIIGHMPEEQLGRRFEAIEIYLLRRLIHASDTGHLASASHGTLREDLRPDMGSVDAVVTAAGDVIDFQFKTFKYGVSAPTRERQAAIHEVASQRLEGSATHLVVLEAEAVQESYEKSLRQVRGTQTSRADKYAALEPMVSRLSGQERRRLLSLIGLSEGDLVREQEDFERKSEERKKFEQDLRQKREEEERRTREIEQRVASVRHEAELAERARLEALENQKREAASVAQTEREAAARDKEQRQLERQQKRAEEARLVAEREQRQKEAEAKEAEKERRRQERLTKKQEAPDWPPKNLVGVCNSGLLYNMGLLPANWQGDAMSFLAAKKRFFELFAKPKRGATQGQETDKPNDLFNKAFPTKESITASTDDDIKRWQELGIKQ